MEESCKSREALELCGVLRTPDAEPRSRREWNSRPTDPGIGPELERGEEPYSLHTVSIFLTALWLTVY